MGSLSLHAVPSGRDMALLTLVISILVASSSGFISIRDRSVVRYLGDSFLLPDGCPVDDPMIQRFYSLCLESHGSDTLCSVDRFPNGRSLTIPQFSNICSAICHNMPQEEMNLCPYKGKVMETLPSTREQTRGEEEARACQRQSPLVD